MIAPTKRIANFDWVETTALTPDEQQTLMKQYDITDDILTYVTDKDETSNYVYDPDNNQQLLIALVPYQLKDPKQLRYIARPVGFLIHNGTLFTFNDSNLNFVTDAFAKASQDPDVATPNNVYSPKFICPHGQLHPHCAPHHSATKPVRQNSQPRG